MLEYSQGTEQLKEAQLGEAVGQQSTQSDKTLDNIGLQLWPSWKSPKGTILGLCGIRKGYRGTSHGEEVDRRPIAAGGENLTTTTQTTLKA